jgi:L-ribulose-5-phosphate 3-epimerase
VVNPQTPYRDAWRRPQEQIRKLIPLAEEIKAVIAIGEVRNKFLLSPIEINAYIQEFQSPWIKAWFDVGNVFAELEPGDEAYLRDVSRRIDRVLLDRA